MNRMSIIGNGLINTIGAFGSSSGSRSGIALNVAYVHLTSGQAIGIRWMAQTTDTIDALYIFLDSTDPGATRANVLLACDIYNESSNVARPGSTLRDSSTATAYPASDDMWIKFTFGTPYTPAIGEILWFVIDNRAVAPGTDYATILTSTTMLVQWSSVAVPYSTTTGFSTNGSGQGEMPFVIVQGSAYTAQPFTQYNASYFSSNQRERGFLITPTEDIAVGGVIMNPGASAYNAVKVYASTTIPGGTALATWDLDSDANQTTGDICGAKTFTPYTFTGGSSYRVAFSFSANSQSPIVLQIEDYSSYSTMFDAIRALDTLQFPPGCISDGGTPEAWVEDNAICPGLVLLVTDNPAQAGGGGLLTHPGYSGRV